LWTCGRKVAYMSSTISFIWIAQMTLEEEKK
jgi:hypothetical protein